MYVDLCTKHYVHTARTLGMALQKNPDVPGFPGSRSFQPLSNGTSGFFLGAGGGSRTHFSHPFPGCLLRVATRCFCSPSPEPIGLRWTMPTPASFPRHFGPRLSEPYKLVEIEESLTIITIVRVSRSILRWLLV